ncbi:MAG: tetratricopeptide repeat protein [Flavobacteriaceae bacterium]|nr:tetratricopeptide repeat protein [Flavobacteriaceae bacterium]
MRFTLCLLIFCFGMVSFSQNENLAKNYFDRGDFEKALPIYRALFENNQNRNDYFLSYIATLQQLENFEESQKLLQERLTLTRNHPLFLIEMGRNHLIQNQSEEANSYFQQALQAIDENPRITYTVANSFEKYSLLDLAVSAYEKGASLDENLNFDSQLARIYGEQGELEKMFDSYLRIIERNPSFLISAQRNFSRYVTDDPQNEANDLLRKALLRRSQNNPDLFYNQLLSWLFVQQKQYDRAFIQEKAIFNRTFESLNEMMELALIALDDEAYEVSNEILSYIIENSTSERDRLQAFQYAMKIEAKTAKKENFAEVEKKYQNLIGLFGEDTKTFEIQLDYYHFLAFQNNKKQIAVENLKKLSRENLSRYQEARVLMQLADILVFDEKFNEALIYYSQIQNKVKNDPIAQEARFKVARTSYFKGDFEWAKTQLDILKKSTSQLIANDAMELSLLISDNSLEDSLQTALKKYARADLLDLQGKHQEAIAILETILGNHIGESIEDEALLKQAQVFEKTNQYDKAKDNYLKIIEFHNEDILADNAYFYLAELYNKTLQQPEKAKEFYEQIIFNHQDSIFFVEARKQYRSIRGDAIN